MNEYMAIIIIFNAAFKYIIHLNDKIISFVHIHDKQNNFFS